MPYRSSEKTRQKKDAKRTALMQAAVQVFAAQGYHAATIRDIVQAAGVAVGTFYFYFPDKETLFAHLYEETGDFLLGALRQAVGGAGTLSQRLAAGINAYLNIATYEPAIVQLVLTGNMGSSPALSALRLRFRQQLVDVWRGPLDTALQENLLPAQNSKRTAQGVAGGLDEMILSIIRQPDPDSAAERAAPEMLQFALAAAGYQAAD